MLQSSSWSLKLIIKSSWADAGLQSHASKCVCFIQPLYAWTTCFASPFAQSWCWAGTPTLPGRAGEQKRVPEMETAKQLNSKFPWAPPKPMADTNGSIAMSCPSPGSLLTPPPPSTSPHAADCGEIASVSPWGTHVYQNARDTLLHL